MLNFHKDQPPAVTDALLTSRLVSVDAAGFVSSYTRADGGLVFKASPVEVRNLGPQADFRYNAVGFRTPGLVGGVDFFSFATADAGVQAVKNLAMGEGASGTMTASAPYPMYGRDYTRLGGGSFLEYATPDLVAGTYLAVARYCGASGLATLFDNYAADTATYFDNAVPMGTYFQLGATSLVGRVTTAKPTTPSMPAHDATLTIPNTYAWRLFAMSFSNDSLTLEDITSGLSVTVAAPVQTWRLTKGATTARIGSSLSGTNQAVVDIALEARYAGVLTSEEKKLFRSIANRALETRGIVV